MDLKKTNFDLINIFLHWKSTLLALIITAVITAFVFMGLATFDQVSKYYLFIIPFLFYGEGFENPDDDLPVAGGNARPSMWIDRHQEAEKERKLSDTLLNWFED